MRDLEQIRKQFNATLKHSQAFTFGLHTEEIIEKWYKAKLPYIELFDGETRIELEHGVELELSDSTLQSKFASFLDELENRGISERYNPDFNLTFRNFLVDNRTGFFQNHLVREYPSLKLGKGAKLLKTFKYFISDWDECRWAQDAASRFIQDTKISGNLYLSVDPLDFLTVSENNNSWRSCHALDGEYRSGNLTYMLDNTTLVAYLANKKNEQLKCMPAGLLWNNKKWRMLIHTNNWESIIYYNRQYPFSNDELLFKVYQGIEKYRTGIKTFAPPAHNSFKNVKLDDDYMEHLTNNYILGRNERIYDMRDVVDDSESFGYTDLVYSNYYTPVYSLAYVSDKDYEYATWEKDRKMWDNAFHDVFDITIGKKCNCVKCGKQPMRRSDSFLCEDCIVNEDADEDLFVACEWCGRRLYQGDKRFNYEGDIICETCNSACAVSGDPVLDERYPVTANRRPLMFARNADGSFTRIGHVTNFTMI